MSCPFLMCPFKFSEHGLSTAIREGFPPGFGRSSPRGSAYSGDLRTFVSNNTAKCIGLALKEEGVAISPLDEFTESSYLQSDQSKECTPDRNVDQDMYGNAARFY
jgi:hypothetical protein